MMECRFQYLTLRLTFRPRELLKLPPAPGSMLRGAFGASLKQMFCRNPRGCGTYCEAGARCTYGRMFETPLDSPHALLGDVRFAPHPFALHAVTVGPALLEPGQVLVMDWTLWGEALRDSTYSLLAWKQAGERGFGVDRSECTLESAIRLDTGALVYSSADQFVGNLAPAVFEIQTPEAATVRLRTLSPLRIKHDRALFGKARSGTQHLPSEVLFRAIERRIMTCIGDAAPVERSCQHDDWPKATWSEFIWQEQTRYSNRQKTAMQVGGVEGRMWWDRLTSEWLRLLRVGEILQVGKNTSMGLGKYQIEVEEL